MAERAAMDFALRPASRGRFVVSLLLLGALALLPATVGAQSIFRSGFEAAEDASLEVAPEVRVLRDDRVATLEMDYDADDPWGQFWEMDGSGEDDAGFLVTWWPAGAAPAKTDALALHHEHAGAIGCLSPDHAAKASAPGARWLVTGNRRVQIQPLVNGAPYLVRVERLDALGRITSHPTVVAFDGGDGARVAALRASLTHFDDFNLPAGAADATLWGNAASTSTDERFNLFFINDQYHAHTLNGTRVENTGDKSQTSQRFRKRMRIEPGMRRRIVFDMDAPTSPRSVWYLDLNPIRTELTGHADFFDQEGATGLPAGMLRLRAQFQTFSVSLIGMDGASHQIASVDMEDVGRQAVPNVRRHFEARVGTDGIQVSIDGREVIDAAFAPYALAPGDYEPLWIGFGYNTAKDGVPYFLLHWDNFGFDGPVVDAPVVHDYVTRIAGSDYQKANRGGGEFPLFTVPIPDDLRPVVPGAVAEAWLVWTYQMGDYSTFGLMPGDDVEVNGGARHALPARPNNSSPNVPDLLAWGVPHTVRVKLGELVQGGPSPLLVGDNRFRFRAHNTGILNVHVEVSYPPGSAPAYTPPAAIHPFPRHADLPRLGPPIRIERVDGVEVGEPHRITQDAPVRIPVSGDVPLDIVAGNRNWANWAPHLMNVPVQSTEVWSSGGTQGIAQVEVFVRGAGQAPPGQRVLLLATARDAPAPQGRWVRSFDSSQFPDGDYELSVQATAPGGLKSHPSYGDETYAWDAAGLSGAYYPIRIRIEN
jgi:hypothetical protein